MLAYRLGNDYLSHENQRLKICEMIKTDNHQAVLKALRQVLREDEVILEPSAMAAFECDALTAKRETPLIVVLPDSTEKIQAILRISKAFSVPIVPRGAGTGLSGGATPRADAILMGLSKLNRVLDINADQQWIWVEPGITNLRVSEVVKKHGLYYAPDPSSQIACSIGGNVAENAGGIHCLKYGLTIHNVLEIECLDADGNRFIVGRQFDGFDLLPLIVGSEGMLAIISKIKLKLLPIPQTAKVIVASFNSIESAGHCVSAIIAEGIIPAGLEMMDALALKAVNQYAQLGYPEQAEAILLCELDGLATEVDQYIRQLAPIWQTYGATDIRISKNESERLAFWQGRKAAFPALAQLAPDYYCMDGTIARQHLAVVLEKISQLSSQYGLPVANVFHAGDGNLHPLILYDAQVDGELAKAERFGGEILSICVEMGGSITGEHGVGREKLDQMCEQFDQTTLALFHGIKSAFDPEQRLNPGKAIPTLTRCSELGGMHSHQGQLPFADIERF